VDAYARANHAVLLTMAAPAFALPNQIMDRDVEPSVGGSIKRVGLFAFVVILLMTAVAAALLSVVLSEPALEDWIARIQHPGYQLLFKRATDTHYFAVFDAGGSQMAICVRDLIEKDNGPGQGFVVYDLEGHDLMVSSLSDRHDELKHEIRTPFQSYRFRNHGVMYPIDPKYVGPVRVVVTQESQTLLDEVLSWPAPREADVQEEP